MYELENRILFRSITPLPRFFIGRSYPDLSINGEIENTQFWVNLIRSENFATAKETILYPWQNELNLLSPEILEYVSTINKCTAYMVIDTVEPKTEDSLVKANTMVGVRIREALNNAMLLFWDGLGPYYENVWELRVPFFGVSYSMSLVTMNQFLCSQNSPNKKFYSEFEQIFRILVSNKWEDTQLGRIFGIAFDSLNSSLRTVHHSHSFVLLAMVFESLFTEHENDWAGGSRRVAWLAGESKGEATEYQRIMNVGDSSIRKLRNIIVHGSSPPEYSLVKEMRQKFAKIVVKAFTEVLLHFDKLPIEVSYYEEVAKFSQIRFDRLPNTIV